MKIAWEILAAAILLAASILFIGRYQISATGSGPGGHDLDVVYRLDRWTGSIDTCRQSYTKQGLPNGIECPASGHEGDR